MGKGFWPAILLFAGVVGALASVWIITEPRPAFPTSAEGALDGAARALDEGGDPGNGKLVFAAGNCASCHASPGQPDRHRLGGGMALASPFGIFRVPNISPDPVDGIGSWRTVDLANALLSGTAPDGFHYYPGFPYPSYAKMQVSDIRDLMAYLRTLPAVSGKPPSHVLSMPFRIRRLIGIWKLLFFDREPIVPDPQQDAAWNRGRYLVESVGHCAECHSSRNLLGAIKPWSRFAGGQDPEGVGFIPNITPARIGDWTVADIAEMLKSGNTPSHGRVGSSMTDVVTNTAMLPESDRNAIAVYVKSLPSRETLRP